MKQSESWFTNKKIINQKVDMSLNIHDQFFRPVAGYVAFFRPNLGRKTKYASEKPGKAQNAFIWLLLMVFEC